MKEMTILTAEEFEKRRIQTQIEFVRQQLHPDSLIQHAFIEMTTLIQMFFNYLEKQVDKKMHKVTEKMATAEKEIKKGSKKAAVKVLKKAEKENEKLVKIDREVRDPMIKKCKKAMKEGGK